VSRGFSRDICACTKPALQLAEKVLWHSHFWLCATAKRSRFNAGAAWVKRYASSAPWATPEALRKLIGPNWIPE